MARRAALKRKLRQPPSRASRRRGEREKGRRMFVFAPHVGLRPRTFFGGHCHSSSAEAFTDSAAVNQALRLLVRLAKTNVPVSGRATTPPRPTSRARPRPKSKKPSRAARG